MADTTISDLQSITTPLPDDYFVLDRGNVTYNIKLKNLFSVPISAYNAGTGCNSTIAGGALNIASNTGSTVGGGVSNSNSAFYGTIAGGKTNIADGDYSTIGGGQTNSACYSYATVSGGFKNCADEQGTFIGGGCNNTIIGCNSTIVGGVSGRIEASGSVIGGGCTNTISSGYYNIIGTGCCNKISGNYSVIAGGVCNCSSKDYTFIGGGCKNCALANYSSIIGGCNNCAIHRNTTIIGSNVKTIKSDTTYVGQDLCVIGKLFATSVTYSNVTQQNVSTLTANQINSDIFVGGSFIGDGNSLLNSNWDSNYGTVRSLSGNWGSVYSSVNSTSAGNKEVTTFVNDNSSNLLTAYNNSIYTINGTTDQIQVDTFGSNNGDNSVQISLPNLVNITNLNVLSTLSVPGTAYFLNTRYLQVSSNIIYFAEGNTGNSLDVGLVSNFDGYLNDGSYNYQHTGLARKAGQDSPGIWTLFSGLTTEPQSTPSGISWSDPTFQIDTLAANIQGSLSGTVFGNVSGTAAQVINGVVTTGSYSNPTWIASLADSKVVGTSRNSWDTAYQLVSAGSNITNYLLTSAFNAYQTSTGASTATLLPISTYQNASGTWQNTFTTVSSNSSNWQAAYALVSGTGGNFVTYLSGDTRYAKLSSIGYILSSNNIMPVANLNYAYGNYSNIAGGICNITLGYYSNVNGGCLNRASGTASNIAGGALNTASGIYSNVAGGYNNNASGSYSSILGGRNNNTNSLSSVILLGSSLTASQPDYTYVNNLSSQGVIWDKAGNSNNWNTAYQLVSSGTIVTNYLLITTFNAYQTSVGASTALLTPLTLTNTLTSQLVTNASLSDYQTSVATTTATLTPLTLTGALTSQLVTNTSFSDYQTSVGASTATLLPRSTYQNASGNWQNAYNNAAFSILGTTNQIVATKTVSSPGNNTYTLSLPTSAIFPGSVSVIGNFSVSGSATYVNTQNLIVGNSVVYLNNNNGNSNILDTGILTQFSQAPLGQQYTGLIRRAGQGYPGVWSLFSGLTTNPLTATNLDWSNQSIRTETLSANILGNLSGSYVTAGNGNSDQWNRTYTTVQNNSGNWLNINESSFEYKFEAIEHFLNGGTTNNATDMVNINLSNAGVINPVSTSATYTDALGVTTYQTGVSAISGPYSGYGVNPTNKSISLGTAGNKRILSRIAMRALPDSTTTGRFVFGFIDSFTALSTNGAYFITANGGTMSATCVSNNVATTVDLGFTPPLNTMNFYDIQVASTGTSVGFYYNNVLQTIMYSTTANIPNNPTVKTNFGINMTRTAAVATSLIFDIDLMYLRFDNPINYYI